MSAMQAVIPRPPAPARPAGGSRMPGAPRGPRSGGSGEPPKKKRKRGVKNEKQYKRNEVRIARLKGQPYVSYTGKLVEGKTIPPAIICKCRSKCHSKLQPKNIQELWNHFYSIDNKNAQDTHLQNWIEVREIKRRKRKKRNTILVEGFQEIRPADLAEVSEDLDHGDDNDNEENDSSDDNEDEDADGDGEGDGEGDEHSKHSDTTTPACQVELFEQDRPLNVNVNDTNGSQEETPQTFRKNFTFIYNVRVNGRITQICKNAFLQVFGVTESRIRRICDLLVHAKIPCDLRGKNRHAHAIEPSIREKIHTHIQQFEVREAYHEGKLRKYLDSSLNVVKMHHMFINEYPDLQNKVKYSFYYQYFKDNFNFEFGHPQRENQRDGHRDKHRDSHRDTHLEAHRSTQQREVQQRDVGPSYETLSAIEPAVDSGVSDDNQVADASVAPELLALKKRAKDFYEALKSATENKDYDTLALAFNYIQNFLVPPHQPPFSYNNYYYPQHDPNMLEWNNHHQNPPHPPHQSHPPHQ